MDAPTRDRPLAVAAGIAVVFGLATVASGGQALFGGPAAARAVGDAVPFVLWFNFVAGFAYVAAGFALWRRLRWAAPLAAAIAIATAAVFVLLGAHVWSGGAHESRTLGAMTLRLATWIAIAWLAWTRRPRRAPAA